MLFLISGRDGSIGYSFFSEANVTGWSLNFDKAIGDDTESEAKGDPFSGDEERGGELELEFELVMEIRKLRSPTEPSEALFTRSSSRATLMLGSFGGTTITSTGKWPFASIEFGSAPADKSSLTTSTALTDPPDAAQ